jgi:hypothetical protein
MVHILRGVGLSGDRDRARSDGSYSHIINGSISAKKLGVIADQIEAQTRPPRIEEPGLWGVVEARPGESMPCCPHEWVRRGDRWHCPVHGYASWDVLVDPVLIRAGLS